VRLLPLLLLLSLALPACVVHSARPAEGHAMRNGYYYLGERWPGVRLVFGPDSTTREIALPGVRAIRRVDFVMNNFPGNGAAKVELWAR
jgi:hypothetical protein